MSTTGLRGQAGSYAPSEPALEDEQPDRSLAAKIIGAVRQHGDVLKNASSLLATTGLTSAMGFAYWAIAARLFPQRDVGYGSASISTLTLLGTIGMFGLGTVLIAELPRRERRGELVSAALLASGLGSIVLGAGFCLIAPHVSPQFGAITGSPVRAVLFTLSVALGAVGAVFDQATIGLFRGGIQLFRNFIVSIVKLLILPVVAFTIHDEFGAGLTFSWAAGMAVSLLVIAIQLRVKGTHVFCRPDWGLLRGLGKVAMAHNWLNLAIAVPFTLIPVMVTVIVSPAANAAFYAAWMLSGFVYIVPQHLSTVLFAVASADPQIVARKLRFTLGLSLLIGIPACFVLGFGAHFALSIFGKNYASTGTLPLQLLALGYVPSIPRVHYIAVCRAAGKINRAATILTVFAIIEVAGAAVGGMIHGLIGLSVALLVISVLEGLATTPAVIRTAFAQGRHRRGEAALAASASSPATQPRTEGVAADRLAGQPLPVRRPTGQPQPRWIPNPPSQPGQPQPIRLRPVPQPARPAAASRPQPRWVPTRPADQPQPVWRPRPADQPQPVGSRAGRQPAPAPDNWAKQDEGINMLLSLAASGSPGGQVMSPKSMTMFHDAITTPLAIVSWDQADQEPSDGHAQPADGRNRPRDLTHR